MRLADHRQGLAPQGVDEAVATVSRLRRAGVPATLDVVGATPPHDRDLAPWVTLWGPLDKGTPTGAAQLDALFRRANFFILPSRADCTPVVLGEAQAYALPVVASDTGGIASMVTPDSGATFELDHFPEEASAFVAGAWSDPALYSGLSRNSRALFDNRHNWAVAVRSVLGSLEAALQGKC